VQIQYKQRNLRVWFLWPTLYLFCFSRPTSSLLYIFCVQCIFCAAKGNKPLLLLQKPSALSGSMVLCVMHDVTCYKMTII